MKRLLSALLLLTMASSPAWAQVNAGEKPAEATLPFTITPVVTDFKLPWRLAFLPDGRMLITEKVGPVWLVTQKGEKTQAFKFKNRKNYHRKVGHRAKFTAVKVKSIVG